MARHKRLPAEPFEVTIDSLLENGRGLAVHQEKRLEVHDALPGERLLVRYLFGGRFKGQAARVTSLLPSPDRVPARCMHFGTCSACALQHMEPGAQLRFKQQTLLRYMRETGGLEPELVLPTLASDQWQYRRKARLSVRYVQGKGRVLVGFRERDGRYVTDMQECHILASPVAMHIQPLIHLLAELEGAKTIPQIEVSCGDEVCALIFRHLEPLGETDLARLRGFAGTTGLAVLLQAEGPDSVRALEPAEPGLSYRLPEFDLEFRFQPLDFVQVNGGLNRAMVSQAVALLDPQPDDMMLDLFCGLGNFTLPLARRCAGVTGIEGDAGLVGRAMANAAHNHIANAIFRQADLYASDGGRAWAGGRFRKVLLDPPRSGAEPVLGQISDTGAVRVVYISCNPATLARDAGILVRQHGFRLQAAGVVDMFPHTTHIESMAVFEREDGGPSGG